MSEGVDKPVVEQQVTETPGPVCGELLTEARRAQQITVLEIAKELHLDEIKVRALESNDFDVVGAPVFAKGHLRKYAQLVGADEDAVFADYNRMTRSSGVPPVVLQRPRIKQGYSPGPWIVGIIAVLIAALASWLIFSRDVPSAAVGSEPELQQQADAAENAPQEATEPVLLAATTRDEAPAGGVLTEASARDAQPGIPPQMVDDGLLHIALSFSGECWTEISDADGQRLFFDMGRSGRDIELSGKAPISVLLGNAANANLRVNGNDYAIPATDRSDRMARLTIHP